MELQAYFLVKNSSCITELKILFNKKEYSREKKFYRRRLQEKIASGRKLSEWKLLMDGGHRSWSLRSPVDGYSFGGSFMRETGRGREPACVSDSILGFKTLVLNQFWVRPHGPSLFLLFLLKINLQ